MTNSTIGLKVAQIERLESEAKEFRKSAQLMTQKARDAETQAEQHRDALRQEMITRGEQVVDLPSCIVTVEPGPPAVVLEADFNEKEMTFRGQKLIGPYVRVKEELNRELLRAHLKAGMNVAFARLESKLVLKIAKRVEVEPERTEV